MPEIAEVRTVAKVLRKNIVGRTIKDIKYRYDGIIKTDKDEFKNILIGRTITDLDTFGKWIII